jgi:O-methyltransferase involved in polyketide biosynthesis
MTQPKRHASEQDIAKALADLGRVSHTLLIPLVARASGGHLFPRYHPHDQYAQYLSHLLHSQVRSFVGDWATVLNILWRTWLIKQAGESFFERHPQAAGVNLGAGLSYYFQWLDNQQNRWVDLDLDPVIQLRKMVFGHTSAHHQQRAFNIKHGQWWNEAGLPKRTHRHPVFLICEGVSMYLTPEQMRAMVTHIAEHAPHGSELVLDYISTVGVGKAHMHPSIGATGSEFRWGCEHIIDVCESHPRLKLMAEHSVAEAYGPGASWMEKVLEPWLGGPMYGLAHFVIQDRSGRATRT